MTCTIDGRAVGCSKGRVSLRHVKVGEHTLIVRATDAAGNVGITEYLWEVDRTRPEVGILDAPRRLSSDLVSSFNLWSSVDPGFFGCSLDGRAAMPCFGSPGFYGLKEGRHTLEVWSYDLAKNHSIVVRYVWKIDRTPPVLTLVGGPREGSTEDPTETTFTVSQSEKGQLFCSLDGVEFSTCSSPIRYATLPIGDHTFEVYAVDAARNQSLTLRRDWTAS
jgi:hypothetical protein